MGGAETVQVGVIMKELRDGAGKSLAIHTFNILSIYCTPYFPDSLFRRRKYGSSRASACTLMDAGAGDRPHDITIASPSSLTDHTIVAAAGMCSPICIQQI